MKIGMIGLGKLGLPVTLAIENRGHEVLGHDTSEEVRRYINTRRIPYREDGAQELLNETQLQLATPSEMVEECDIIFVAVQTPHAPEYEGITRLPATRADFDYSYLREAVGQVAQAAALVQRPIELVVISTVLPGTIRREILPLLNPYVSLVYNPYFIAMGTTIPDFMEPEFVLLGSDDEAVVSRVEFFYSTIHDRPCERMGIEEAELTKVAYNTFITSKIVFANTLMEICDHMGANVDAVTGALAKATDRVISPKYLRAGMGDGGGCHPRDNIALSSLARKFGLSYDLFGALMKARETQTTWLASMLYAEHKRTGLPIVILGKAFKAGTNIITGSPALLLRELLDLPVVMYDPHIDEPWMRAGPALFFLATDHPEFKAFPYPPHSVVIDPWGSVPEQPGVRIRRIGRESAKVRAEVGVCSGD